ncbi:hypothetical protein D3Z62_02875 [Lachnospiraceae bacterium]|nr:hypothetical protein [Lachnospiraceae bacterium]
MLEEKKKDEQKIAREKFYFKVAKECLKEKTKEIKEYQGKIMRITVFMVILTIGITELFEVIKSLLIYTNIINNVVRIKNGDESH